MAGRPIDEKIVAMKMDNSDFKRKATETTSMFGKLKNALNKIPGVKLGGTVKDLAGIQSAVNKTDFSQMTSSLDKINDRFSALNVMATTALVNITNRAVNAGLALKKSLTTDQVRAGFQEYELKMGSIQTILANTQRHGTTLKEVNEQFEILNDYADKTIYSFGDMTRNIGLFTNAGLELEESVSMIKGFSNAAAASGTNATKAAGAAYQLSQGLSAGYLMQMDWMSLTNAGMGNDNMKRDLIALGQAMGTLTADTETAITDWKELLSEDKWLTSDVMSTYLQAMAGDLDKATLMAKGLSEAQADVLLQNAQIGEESATYIRTFTQMMDTLQEGIGSSWATSAELIFGDFEEATKLWTGISEAITPFFEKQGKRRNDLLRFLSSGDGLSNITTGLLNSLKPIGQIFTVIGDGFKRAFPPTNSLKLIKMTELFKKFSEGLAFSETTVKRLTNVFAGIFSVFSTGWEVVKALSKLLLDLLPSFETIGGAGLKAVDWLADFAIKLGDSAKSGELFETIMARAKSVIEGINTGVEWLIKNFDTLGGAIAETVSILVSGDFTGKGPWSEDSKMVSVLYKIRDGFVAFGDGLKAANKGVKDSGDKIGAFFQGIKDGYNWVKDKLAGFGNWIVENFPSGEDLLAGGVLTAMALIVRHVIKTVKDFSKGMGGWATMSNDIKDLLESVQDSFKSFTKAMKAKAILGIAIAVAVLAGSLILLSVLDGAEIGMGLTAIAISLGSVVGAMKVLDELEVDSGGMGTMGQIIAMAIAMSILAGALKKISDMSWQELLQGVLGLTVVLGAFSGAITLMSRYGKFDLAASALQLLAFAISARILAGAIEPLGKMDPVQLTQAVIGLAAILAAMGAFVKLSSDKEAVFTMGAAAGILAISFGIGMIADALEQIGNLDTEVLNQGFITLTAIMMGIAAFMKATNEAEMLAAGAGILLMAVAMNALIVPIAALGNMDTTTLVKGLYAMTIALVAIGAASMLMTGMLASGAGLLLMAVAINALIIPITTLGQLKLSTIVKGIIAIAGAFLVIGGVAALLGLASPFILAFAIAITLMGVAMLAGGTGMSLFATSLITLATLSSAAVVTIVATIGTLIAGLATLIPTAVDFMVQLVMQIATAIAENTPILAEKVLVMILGIVTAIADNAPLIYDQFLKLILGLIESWGENVPKIVGAAMEAITALLTAIGERVGDFIEAGVSIVTGFLDGVADALPELAESAFNLVLTFIETMSESVRENGPKLTDAVLELVGSILLVIIDAGVKVINALFGWIPGVEDATAEIGSTAEKYISDNFGAESLAQAKGDEFAGGLDSKGETIEDSAAGLAALAEGGLDIDVTDIGKNFGEGFAKGIGKAGKSVWESAKGLAKKAADTVSGWLDVRSPSRVTMAIGKYFGDGLAIGIKDRTKQVGKSAKAMALTAKDSLNQFIDGFDLPGDNELHFKAVVDYESLDTKQFGSLRPLTVQPDVSATNRLVSSTKAELRQNRSINPMDVLNKTLADLGDNLDNSEVVALLKDVKNGIKEGKVITMDSRKVGEVLQPHIKKIQDSKDVMKNRAKGLLT